MYATDLYNQTISMAGSTTTVVSRLIQTVIRSKTHHPNNRPSPAKILPNSAILRHLDDGNLPEAISVLKSTSSHFPSPTYVRLLRLCSLRRSLVDARRVESHLISTSSTSPPLFLLNLSIRTYAELGSLRDARELFDEMPKQDPDTHNTIISAYNRAGRLQDSVFIFSTMTRRGFAPTDVTFALVLSACANLPDLPFAMQLHGRLEKSCLRENVILGTALVDVYGKCQLISEARKAFDSIGSPNAVSWNVIVRRYLEVGEGKEAVGMFFRMIGDGIRPLNFTVSNALMACSDVLAVREGREVHGIVVKMAYGGDNVVENSLMEMYSKCGALEDAYRVFVGSMSKGVVSWTLMVSRYAECGCLDKAELIFEEMPQRDVVSWNAMLAGYARFAQWDVALAFFHRMRSETKETDFVSLGLVLNICAGLSDLDKGKQVHGFAYRHGFLDSIFFNNALIDMYSKCGNLKSAETWFVQMENHRDRASWNSLLSGYCCSGRSNEAFDTFGEMQHETSPNEITLSILMAACANTFSLEIGKQIHGYILRNGFEMDVVTRGALVNMYSKCRLIEYASRVFEGNSYHDITLLNSMILGCAYNERGKHGLKLFETMTKGETKVDNNTFFGVLVACIGEGFVNLGRRYFDSMITEYGVIPRIEHYELMIELLGKHGLMDELEDFMQKISFEPTITMWTRVLNYCKEYGNARLGERAASFINESHPSVSSGFVPLQKQDNQ